MPVLRSTERALRALAHATAYGQALAEKPGKTAAIDAPPLPGRGTLPEYQGKAYLAALGIAVPAGRARARCRRSESNRAAHRLSGRAEGAGRGARAQERRGRCRAQHRGRCARSTPHGSEMQARLAKAQPGLVLDGMLVEAMARDRASS